MGVPKFPKLGLPWLWGPITLCADLRLKWGLKKSCSPHREIFNIMSHATCTQGNWVDSWLLVVRSQTVNLTLGLFFGHNLCFRCPNGSFEFILDICVSIAFQRYKKRFNPMGFNPCNRSLKIRESTETLTPQVGTHSLTLSCTPRSIRCASRASPLSRTLASPCLGHKSKVKVATCCTVFWTWIITYM
jgi:hypothetical protein